MGGDGAKSAAAEASAHDGDRVLDHLEGGNGLFVARMWLARITQAVNRVHRAGRDRQSRRVADHGLTIVALTLTSTESHGQDACDHGGNHTIQVRADDDGVPVLKYRGGYADDVHVCLGDRIQWVLNGSDRKFLIDFLSGAPFEGATTLGSTSNVVSMIIGASAERRDYDYDVQFADGQGMDPRIIVD